MRTYWLDLLFLEAPEDALSQPPISHVIVKHAGTHEYPGVPKVHAVTHRALSLSELQGNINTLRTELDRIEEAARRKYAAARGKDGRRFEKANAKA